MPIDAAAEIPQDQRTKLERVVGPPQWCHRPARIGPVAALEQDTRNKVARVELGKVASRVAQEADVVYEGEHTALFTRVERAVTELFGAAA